MCAIVDEQFGLDFLTEILQETEYVTFSIRGVGEKTYATTQFKKAVEQIATIADLTKDALNDCNCAVSAHKIAEILELSQQPTMTKE